MFSASQLRLLQKGFFDLPKKPPLSSPHFTTMADKFICEQVFLQMSSFFLPADEGAPTGDGQTVRGVGRGHKRGEISLLTGTA